MFQQKLASIEKILSIEAIQDADKIVKAQVLGFQTVIRKDDFEVGDLVVFIVPDTIVPSNNPYFSFLEKDKYRVKVKKLRGCVSMGLCCPLDMLPTGSMIDEGEDVSTILQVTHYEKPVPAANMGKMKGNFPSFLFKTDVENIKSYPILLEEFHGKECYISTKVDGSSGTFSHHAGQIDVCSRNWSIIEDDQNMYWKVFRKHDLENKLKSLGNYAVQGEIAGPGVQKNKMELTELSFFVFDILDINQGRYLDFEDMKRMTEKLGLTTVPIENPKIVFNFTMDELDKMARGKYWHTKNPKEGIVIRPVHSVYSHTLYGRLSCKVLNEDFLLKYGE